MAVDAPVVTRPVRRTAASTPLIVATWNIHGGVGTDGRIAIALVAVTRRLSRESILSGK